VIAAIRPVNKNVNTGAVRAKPGTDRGSSGAFINYWRTITGGYKFRPMSGWNGTIGSRSAFQFITHPLNPIKHDDWHGIRPAVRRWPAARLPVHRHGTLSVSLLTQRAVRFRLLCMRVACWVHRHKFTWRFSLRFLQCVLWLNDTSYSKSVWRDK